MYDVSKNYKLQISLTFPKEREIFEKFSQSFEKFSQGFPKGREDFLGW